MNNNSDDIKNHEKVFSESNTYVNESTSKTENNDILNGIVFSPRNSPLTDLFKEKQGKALYYSCASISLCLLWNVLLESYIMEQKNITGIRLLVSGFQNVHLAFLAWLVVVATVLLTFKCYNIWAKKRITLKEKSCKQWDWFWISALVLYYFNVILLVSKSVYVLDLPFLIATAYQIDCVRLLMKVHSFVRNNAPAVIKHSKESNTSQSKVSKQFNRFIYFLFAPTLIYKDEYPRTQTIRWRFAFTCALELALAIITTAIIADLYLFQPFENIATEPLSRKHIILYLSRCNFAGVMLMMCINYIALHTLQNFFAELTRFADRGFYQDWWCTSSVGHFLKTWNVLVYKWLFVYIYKEFYNNVYQHKDAAKAMVIFISDLFHEIILTCSMKIFFPFHFVMYYITAMITTDFIKTKDENVSQIIAKCLFFWGSGVLMTAYYLEYSARFSLPVVNTYMFANVIPRSWLLIV